MAEDHEEEEQPVDDYDEYGDEPPDTEPIPDPTNDDFYDPYRPTSGGVVNDGEVLFNFVEDLTTFTDHVFSRPPAPMRGVWFGQQKAAWAELTAERADERRARRQHVFEAMDEAQQEALAAHGLTGQALQTKMRLWRDKVRAFLQLRNTRRLKAVFSVGGVVFDSLLEATGLDPWLKEVVKGLKELADTASEEGA